MRKRWVSITVVLVLTATGMFIASLRLSHIPDLAIGHSNRPASMAESRVKVLSYEVQGPVGASTTVSYLDESGFAQNATASLPWTLQLHTRNLTVAGGVVAQSEAGGLTCRILIDGAVRDQRHSETQPGAVNCQVLVS
ncbi:MmpS family transport accessory protein [Mycobacterium sp. LTG2003]